MPTSKKLSKAAPQSQTAQALLLQRWEQAFRTDFAGDGGARFEPLIQRFDLRTDAMEMLEGTVDFVLACAAFAIMDGVEIGSLLADQSYDAQMTSATYSLTFDLCGRSSARLHVRPDMRSIDLADLYGFPWDRLRMVGYGDLWVSRLDGEDLSTEEVRELDRVVSNDIWFDYSEEEISIIFDPDTYAGALAITVYEQIEDAAEIEMPEARNP